MEGKSLRIRSNPVYWKTGSFPDGIAFCPPDVGKIVIYCNEMFGKDNWDILNGVLYFKYEKDATMFALRWGGNES